MKAIGEAAKENVSVDARQGQAASKFSEQDDQEIKMGKSAFEQKCDVLQVQRAEVFQDSLDELPIHINEILEESVKKAQQKPDDRQQVLDENGRLLDVIFDPVLKCYYEPTNNVYYQVKDIQKVMPSTRP